MPDIDIIRNSIVRLVNVLHDEMRHDGRSAVLVHGGAMLDVLVDAFRKELNMHRKVRLSYEEKAHAQDLLNRNTVQDRRGDPKETR